MQFNIYTVLCVGILSFVLLIVLLLIAFKKVRAKASIKDRSFEIDSSGNEVLKTNPQSLIMLKVIELIDKKRALENSVYTSQMRYAKAKGVLIIDMLLEAFKPKLFENYKIIHQQVSDFVRYSKTEEFKSACSEYNLPEFIETTLNRFKNIVDNPDNIIRTEEYRSYYSINNWNYFEMVNKFSELFEVNGLDEMTEKEFIEYKQDKVKCLFLLTVELLDQNWLFNTVDRQELRLLNNYLCISKIHEVMLDI